MSTMQILDASDLKLREINRRLQRRDGNRHTEFEVLNPKGVHALAVGLNEEIHVRIKGHAGYYCGGMNQRATIEIDGNAGTGLAENMMSGLVRVRGDASQAAGATAHGGLLVIHGNASARCGISMKGIDIVVGGSVGHNTAFMGQSGRLVICGDAEAGLGDSLYEATIYLRGKADGLGADCIEKPMDDAHFSALKGLLDKAGFDHNPLDFRRYGSARQLYNFKIDNVGAY